MVKSEHDDWAQEEVSKEGILHKTTTSVENHEEVENVVPMVGEPEGLEPVTTGIRDGKHKDYYGNEGQYERAETSHGEEEPV